MSLLSKKSAWKKIVVELNGGMEDRHDLHITARDMTDALWEATKEIAGGVCGAPMFFACYSNPGNDARVEIKAELDWPALHIEAFFRRTSFWSAQFIKNIAVTSFNESPAHALAYLLSRELRGKGEELTKDVLHWALNMTGYSYPQEIRILAEHTAHIAGNMEKL